MRSISAVALYGPKGGPVRDALVRVQGIIAEQIGDRFRPYSLAQIHATLIALNAMPDSGRIVNEYYLTRQGRSVEMELPAVMDTLATRFADPLRVRIGGHRRDEEVPFTSRGQHLFDRSFSVQGDAFVLVGWPVASLAGSGRPLDELRREMNAAGLLHRYHARDTDVDNDLHLVVGHQVARDTDETAGADATAGAVSAVREWLAGDPVEVSIGLEDVKIVAADSPTLASPLYVSDIPADLKTLRALMQHRGWETVGM